MRRYGRAGPASSVATGWALEPAVALVHEHLVMQATHLESGFVVRLAGRGVGSEGCTNRGCLARAVPVDVTPVANNGMQTEAA